MADTLIMNKESIFNVLSNDLDTTKVCMWRWRPSSDTWPKNSEQSYHGCPSMTVKLTKSVVHNKLISPTKTPATKWR